MQVHARGVILWVCRHFDGNARKVSMRSPAKGIALGVCGHFDLVKISRFGRKGKFARKCAETHGKFPRNSMQQGSFYGFGGILMHFDAFWPGQNQPFY